MSKYSVAIGDGSNYAGMMGFKVLAADRTKKVLKIQTSGDIESALSGIAANEDTMVYYAYKEGYQNGTESMFQSRYCGIVSKEDSTISVTLLPAVDPVVGQSWVLFPKHPLAGDQPVGDGAFATGWGNIAMEDGSAIGINNESRGRYAHTIGASNKAGYSGIAIGAGNSAYGRCSIAMGGNW